MMKKNWSNNYENRYKKWDVDYTKKEKKTLKYDKDAKTHL